MTQAKLKNDYQNIQIKNSTVNRNEDDDIAISYQNCKPPPPPGREDLWELQFCRWWGWNWVRKREEQQKAIGTQRPMEPVKPQKKHFKELCNCLCFKKKEKVNPNIQKLYNTPSNSVILCETYTCGVLEKKNDSISRLEYQRNISQKSRRKICEEKCNQVQSWAKVSNDSSSSCDDCCRCCEPNNYRSSTEESIEYLNIKCCPCCHPTEPPAPKKCNCETQTSKHDMKVCITQTCQQKNFCATQTTKKKKKRICLICCHCRQVCCCCKCNKGEQKLTKPIEISCCTRACVGKEQSNASSLNQQKRNSNCQGECTGQKKQNSTSNDKTDKKSNDKQEANNTNEDKTTENNRSDKNENPKLKTNWEPTYMKEVTYPLTTQFYNKHFSKFGMPSQNYPWVQNTKSDILDKIYSMRIDEEFSSPLSGKTYNLSPVKVDNFDIKGATIPDPIDVLEEVNHLRQLESEIKMDLESRIMLDAVCDAILSKNPDVTSSSTFLNEYTYKNDNLELENILNKVNKSYSTLQNNINNNCFPVLKNPSLYNNEKESLHLTEKDKLLIYELNSQGSNDITKILQQNKFKKETMNVVNIMPTPSNLLSEVTDFNKIFKDIKTTNCFDTNCTELSSRNYTEPLLFHKTLQHPLTNTNIIPYRKRSASALLAEQANKRIKSKTNDNLGIVDCVTNISDIFNKIDEIVLKSKVNDEEIRNVLNTIPKKTYQFFSPGSNENSDTQMDRLLKNNLLESTDNGNKTNEKLKENNETDININYGTYDSCQENCSKPITTKKKKRDYKSSSQIPLKKRCKVKASTQK